MDKTALDTLARINNDLVDHLKWLLEKKDLDALAKVIPIAERLTRLLIELRKENS